MEYSSFTHGSLGVRGFSVVRKDERTLGAINRESVWVLPCIFRYGWIVLFMALRSGYRRVASY